MIKWIVLRADTFAFPMHARERISEALLRHFREFIRIREQFFEERVSDRFLSDLWSVVIMQQLWNMHFAKETMMFSRELITRIRENSDVT